MASGNSITYDKYDDRHEDGYFTNYARKVGFQEPEKKHSKPKGFKKGYDGDGDKGGRKKRHGSKGAHKGFGELPPNNFNKPFTHLAEHRGNFKPKEFVPVTEDVVEGDEISVSIIKGRESLIGKYYAENKGKISGITCLSNDTDLSIKHKEVWKARVLRVCSSCLVVEYINCIGTWEPSPGWERLEVATS